MSQFVGWENVNGEMRLIKYAIVFCDPAWKEVKGRHGYYRGDYLELLEQFDEDASYWDEVIPVAEDYAIGAIGDLPYEYPDGFSLDIESYSPTDPHCVLDTIIVYPDGTFEHDNILTQGYGTDHCFD